MYYFIDLSL